METTKNKMPGVKQHQDHATIRSLDWQSISGSLHQRGFTLIPRFLGEESGRDLVSLYDRPGIYRKTVVMERHRFGLGEYKYFQYPLPELLQNLRTELYPYLVPVANQWMEVPENGKNISGNP